MTTKSKKTTETKKPTENRTREQVNRLSMLNNMLTQQRDLILRGMQKNQSGDETQAHGDLVDQSNSFSDREILLGLAEHDRKQLAAIDEALEMIDKGTYGVCARCGSDIPEARLSAMPTAKHCVKCQSQMETGR